MSLAYFDPAVGGNGTTVTDDSSATTGLGNGGHRTRFVPALSQVVSIAANVVANATQAVNSATLAQNWATYLGGPVPGQSDYSAKYYAQTAMNAPGTQATSTTSLAVGLGSKSLTLAKTGKAFVVGQYVQIVNSTSAWMAGLITAFTPATGAMTVNVTNTGGSGTLASWTITPTNPPELPSQSGNSGKALITDGSTDSWAFIDTIVRSARTASTSIGLADRRKLIDITSGTFTQTFDAAATLGHGWWCVVANSGSGDITLDPNGSETIDGLATLLMPPGKWVLVQSDGANLYIAAENTVDRTVLFTAVGTSTWTKVNGLKFVDVTVVGGGAAGRGANGTSPVGAAGGGGGGAARKRILSSALGVTETVTVGSGGAGVLGTSAPGAGGSSSFGAHASATGGGVGVAGSPGRSGSGGDGLGGDENLRGGHGGNSYVPSGTQPNVSGAGGSSIFGDGGASVFALAGVDGNSATVYGAGGSGAAGDNSGTARTGGNGYQGIVIVKETY